MTDFFKVVSLGSALRIVPEIDWDWVSVQHELDDFFVPRAWLIKQGIAIEPDQLVKQLEKAEFDRIFLESKMLTLVFKGMSVCKINMDVLNDNVPFFTSFFNWPGTLSHGFISLDQTYDIASELSSIIPSFSPLSSGVTSPMLSPQQSGYALSRGVSMESLVLPHFTSPTSSNKQFLHFPQHKQLTPEAMLDISQRLFLVGMEQAGLPSLKVFFGLLAGTSAPNGEDILNIVKVADVFGTDHTILLTCLQRNEALLSEFCKMEPGNFRKFLDVSSEKLDRSLRDFLVAAYFKAQFPDLPFDIVSRYDFKGLNQKLPASGFADFSQYPDYLIKLFHCGFFKSLAIDFSQASFGKALSFAEMHHIPVFCVQVDDRHFQRLKTLDTQIFGLDLLMGTGHDFKSFLTVLARNPGLEDLHVRNSFTGQTQEIINSLPESLRVLDFSQHALSVAQVDALLGRCKALNTLIVKECKLGDTGFAQLCFTAKEHGIPLEKVELHNNDIHSFQPLIDFPLAYLRYIDFTNNFQSASRSDSYRESLAAFKSIRGRLYPNLYHFGLHNAIMR